MLRNGWRATGEQLTHFADRNTPLNPPLYAAYCFNIGQGIQSVPTIGAFWFDKTITPLPSAQCHRVDTGETRHFSYRE